MGKSTFLAMNRYELVLMIQYGLQKAFSKVDMQKAQVTSSGNPIKIATTTEYTLTALGAKKTINSVIEIETAAGKITKVSDNWEGGIPESSIAQVSARSRVPFASWCDVRDHKQRLMIQAFRRLNAVSVPKMVGVPKTDAEDAKRDTPAS